MFKAMWCLPRHGEEGTSRFLSWWLSSSLNCVLLNKIRGGRSVSNNVVHYYIGLKGSKVDEDFATRNIESKAFGFDEHVILPWNLLHSSPDISNRPRTDSAKSWCRRIMGLDTRNQGANRGVNAWKRDNRMCILGRIIYHRPAKCMQHLMVDCYPQSNLQRMSIRWWHIFDRTTTRKRCHKPERCHTKTLLKILGPCRQCHRQCCWQDGPLALHFMLLVPQWLQPCKGFWQGEKQKYVRLFNKRSIDDRPINIVSSLQTRKKKKKYNEGVK